MHHAPARLGAVFLLVLSPIAAHAQTVDGSSPPAVFTDNAHPAVPVASVAPVGPGQPAVSDMVHTDSKGRHLAPHGTLYLLDYVSVKTDKGVEGFEPGQVVHVVEVHRPTQTLVVSDGRAQVEVSPAKLTHDMDIAAMVRRKDQANQAQIAAYVQAEETAYHKAQKEAADATSKDLDRYNKEQVDASRIVDTTGVNIVNQPAQPVDANVGGGGYYGSGGYGYGSPYSYFSGDAGNVTVANPAVNPATNGAANPTATGNSAVNPASRGAALGGATGAAGSAAGAGSGSAGQVANPAAQGTAGRGR